MEIWKDIIGYEGYYQISNLGNVKNIQTNKILISKINENPELKTILMLDYVNDDLVVTEEELPVELYSTMGKRKLQPI